MNMKPFTHDGNFPEIGLYSCTGEDGNERSYLRCYCHGCKTPIWYNYHDLGWLIMPSFGELESLYQSMIANAGSTHETH